MLPIFLYFFGDSNLFGLDPTTFYRYPSSIRFAERTVSELQKQYPTLQSHIDGKPGRSLKYEYQTFGIVNGFSSFTSLLLSMKQTSSSHRNILILSISINDILSQANPESVVKEVEQYITQAKNYSDVIFLVPPSLKECISDVWKGIVLPAQSNSVKYVELLKKSVEEWKEKNILKEFILLEDVPVGCDGLHYTSEAHSMIYERLVTVLKTILSN